MKTQAQGVGHQGQGSQVMSNGFNPSRSSSATCWKPWHKEDDGGLRREVFSRIPQLLQNQGLEKNVLEIAKDVETALYLDAASKEEYGDLQTLDLRLYSLMQRLRSSRKHVQKGFEPGSVALRASTPACSNGSLDLPGITTGVLLGGEHLGSSFSFNAGSASVAAEFGSNVLSITSGPGSVPGHCFNQEQGTSVGQYRFVNTGVAVTSPYGNNNLSNATASCMIPTPGYNLKCFGVTTKPEDQKFNNGSMNTADDLLMDSDQWSQHVDGGIFVKRVGMLGNEAALSGCSGLPSVLQTAGKEWGISGGSSASAGALNSEQSFMRSQYLHHGRQQPSNGVLGANGPLVAPSDNHAGVNCHVSTWSTRFGTGDLSSLAYEVQIPINEKEKVGKNLSAANEDYAGESGSSAAGLHAPPKNQVNIEFSSHLQARHIIGDQNGLHTGAVFAENQWHLQQSVQSNLCLNLQPNLSEQACQASSADTGQSEVVSNDDGLLPKRSKDSESIPSTQEVKRQQWLLIFLRHVSRCIDSGKCTVTHCALGRENWKHLTVCQVYPCSYPRCSSLKWLLGHHQKCRNVKCVVCGPVRHYFSQQASALRASLRRQSNLEPDNHKKELASVEVDSPPIKRAKVEIVNLDTLKEPHQLFGDDSTSCHDKLSTTMNRPISSTTAGLAIEQQSHQGIEVPLAKVESPTESSSSGGLHSQEKAKHVISDNRTVDSQVTATGAVTQEVGSVLRENQVMVHVAPVVSNAIAVKESFGMVLPPKSRVSGISFIESFSPVQIREHIASLRKWIGQSKCKAEKNQAVERQMLASACSTCGVENLYFDPIPIFCTQCGCRIKRNYIYYSTGAGENSFNFCGPCYTAFRDDVLETDGFKVQKSMLVKKKNDEQRVEGWVECDKCKKWQHQICVLFNARINKERSEYACPDCCISEMERCERLPLLANSMSGAVDLPKTILSDYLEERLVLKLKEERMERSRALGKEFEEVSTAEGLVIRVISSVDKKLDVKAKFLELFQQDNYPKDFLYKSKMVMLFQKIEGVEVCLFGMYVQEFGSDCPQPNHRWVYISYLDSVKYFRPDVKTSKGEALRTFVYHEILIGYLDYCKKRGFSSCYIWACPPLKGDDYILYCHPEIQKTPKTDKLREWYLSMISKAKKEKIVVANKNLYDYFFTTGNDCDTKVSAARLPYFDGDYWPGAAEDILQQLDQEKDGYYSQRRGKTNKIIAKRTTKTSSQTDLGGRQSKDAQLMSKLGQSIAAMKEDFIIVQMHHACSRCRLYIVSGCRWVCQQCSGNFQLCASCHEKHEKLEEEDRHPAGKRDMHQLTLAEEVRDIPADTKDKDDIMESEFFDNRQAFLSLCQGNQYQYDTLRRAKHSSMMVLYHLHNPNAPAFIASCAVCHSELEAGQGWKCKTCTDFDVCSGCYTSGEVQRHPHKFTARSAAADVTSVNSDLRKQRMLQLRMMLEVLIHASKCHDPSCLYSKCRNMKELFRHGNSCTKRAMGGCSICKRMWFLLTTHARACKETVCSVPRCMDIRKHLKRTQLQQDSRRRAAVNEMIRQRAAEAAGVQ